MAELLERLTDIATLVRLGEMVMSVLQSLLIPFGFLLAVYLFELRGGADPNRYRTRNFLHDVIYLFVYVGGFYDVFALAIVLNAIESHLEFLQIAPTRSLPWPVGLAIFWVGGDFVVYWWHRLQHSNRFLWAFHSVHHSQEHITLFTASRRHPVEQLSMDLLLFFFIFHLVLGVPTRGWVPLAVLVRTVSSLQHAQLDWRFGPLHKVLVSPRFHAFHHSAQPEHANANYGFLFSTWDYIFGTAVPEQPLPVRYGLDGIEMKESLAGHLITPFRLLWQWRHRGSAATPEVNSDISA